jgi:peptidoglycan/xylan/chitin deacetylase (PgdA/CDA1 family)
MRRYAILNGLLGFSLLLAGLFGFGLGIQAATADYMLIFALHGISEKPTAPWEITPHEFTEIITTLKKYGFSALDPEKFPDWHQGKLPAARRFLLTFDDGLKTSAQLISRLQTEDNIKSVFFLTTDLLGQPGYITADEIPLLAKTGVTIGLHGKRHVGLPAIQAQGGDVAAELSQACRELETLTEKPITWFAYPYGEFSSATRTLVASMGWAYSCTIESQIARPGSDPHLLPRLMFLRGQEATGELSVKDFLPPADIRNSGLLFTLSLFIMIWSARAWYRCYLSTKTRPPAKT